MSSSSTSLPSTCSCPTGGSTSSTPSLHSVPRVSKHSRIHSGEKYGKSEQGLFQSYLDDQSSNDVDLISNQYHHLKFSEVDHRLLYSVEPHNQSIVTESCSMIDNPFEADIASSLALCSIPLTNITVQDTIDIDNSSKTLKEKTFKLKFLSPALENSNVDLVYNLNGDATIRQIKEILLKDHPLHPRLESQKIIFRGCVLDDPCPLFDILVNDDMDVHIFHLSFNLPTDLKESIFHSGKPTNVLSQNDELNIPSNSKCPHISRPGNDHLEHGDFGLSSSFSNSLANELLFPQNISSQNCTFKKRNRPLSCESLSKIIYSYSPVPGQIFIIEGLPYRFNIFDSIPHLEKCDIASLPLFIDSCRLTNSAFIDEGLDRRVSMSPLIGMSDNDRRVFVAINSSKSNSNNTGNINSSNVTDTTSDEATRTRATRRHLRGPPIMNASNLSLLLKLVVFLMIFTREASFMKVVVLSIITVIVFLHQTGRFYLFQMANRPLQGNNEEQNRFNLPDLNSSSGHREPNMSSDTVPSEGSVTRIVTHGIQSQHEDENSSLVRIRSIITQFLISLFPPAPPPEINMVAQDGQPANFG